LSSPSVTKESFYNTDTCSSFHKHFPRVTYNRSSISCTVVLCMLAYMQSFKNALAYFSTAIGYIGKMYI
jgi:hypothetical protein